MNDAQDGAAGTGRGPDGAEPVGSVGEEAAKLFGALNDWARDQGTDHAGGAGQAVGSFADSLGDAVRNVGEHVATGGEDCRYCPVCQVIHVVRRTSPEVRAHLAVAASSLAQAAAGLLGTQPGEQRESSPVEKIDLDPGSGWDKEP